MDAGFFRVFKQMSEGEEICMIEMSFQNVTDALPENCSDQNIGVDDEPSIFRHAVAAETRGLSS